MGHRTGVSTEITLISSIPLLSCFTSSLLHSLLPTSSHSSFSLLPTSSIPVLEEDASVFKQVRYMYSPPRSILFRFHSDSATTKSTCMVCVCPTHSCSSNVLSQYLPLCPSLILTYTTSEQRRDHLLSHALPPSTQEQL